MQAEGGTIVKHIKELAFMGFVEVVANLRTILGNIKLCKQDILDFKPDMLILVDYPGFNLRIAEFAHQHNISVQYYISPQIWAWKKGRGHKIKKCVDEMYTILPFEKEFYTQFDMDVHFVGHPLLDEIASFTPEGKTSHISDDKPIIALLPGSRQQEIKVKLPEMLKLQSKFNGYQFVIAGAPSQEESFYRTLMNGADVPVVFGATYELLSRSHAALVTSGTATLETALFEVPQVVCYKGGAVSYSIAKRLVNIEYISLVNLIMDRPVVTELIQHDMNAAKIEEELREILSGSRREQMLEDYKELIGILGGAGASEHTAKLMLKTLSND